MRKIAAFWLSAIIAFSFLTGCSGTTGSAPEKLTTANMGGEPLADSQAISSEFELHTQQSSAAIPDILEPVASGELIEQNDRVTIDYSNTADGYIMVLFSAETSARLKAQIIGPSTKYTYNLTPGSWAILPLTDGNGSYQFKIFENISESQYSLVLAAAQDVALADEFAPFLRPNQYVDYTASSLAVGKAQELCQNSMSTLEKVQAVYEYVINTLTYDYEKASTVTSGYVPVLDDALSSQKGICFDYAALMTGMLRSQGVPCKMVFGYAGETYHAWISVWTEDEGWVDGAIFFDGTTWQRLDPTFASSADGNDSINEYIGDGNNYQEKYFY